MGEASGQGNGVVPFRVGLGSDLHRLEPAADSPGIPLCGVTIPCALRTLAHSDGDAALHAVIDALLGALSLGDIGDLFPDTAAENRGRDSASFATEALRRVSAAGYAVGNVDLVIRLQRPKLSEYKMMMRERLASMLTIGIERVSVKAKTGEGLDAVGRGEAVAVEAVVLLLPRKRGGDR